MTERALARSAFLTSTTTTSDTTSGSLLFRRWETDNFPYAISIWFTWTCMTNYITGFDYAQVKGA